MRLSSFQTLLFYCVLCDEVRIISFASTCKQRLRQEGDGEDEERWVEESSQG